MKVNELIKILEHFDKLAEVKFKGSIFTFEDDWIDIEEDVNEVYETVEDGQTIVCLLGDEFDYCTN